jgi:hypothetical protein
MGTSIELTVGGVSLDYSKNSIGFDWGHLFQDGDLTSRRDLSSRSTQRSMSIYSRMSNSVAFV